MSAPYHFIIRDRKYVGYKRIASFLFIINAVFFGTLSFSAVSVSRQLILGTASFILLAYAIYHWRYKKKKERSYIIIYLLIAVIWITETAYPYLSILYILLLLLQYRMENDLQFTISSNAVVIDRLFKTQYQWSVFNNIILKDGLLTLDFTNNKVIQVEPDWGWPAGITSSEELPLKDTEDYPVLEKEFNDFCKEQLHQ